MQGFSNRRQNVKATLRPTRRVVQRQIAVAAYFSSKQLLPFVFELQYILSLDPLREETSFIVHKLFCGEFHWLSDHPSVLSNDTNGNQASLVSPVALLFPWLYRRQNKPLELV